MDDEPTDDDDTLSMREQIIGIVVEALRKQGYPTLTRETVAMDDAHRQAFIDMLGDCRPLPVVRRLMEDARRRRI